MDVNKTANTIAMTLVWIMAIALGIYLVIKLPLWLAPFVFAVAVFFLLAFVGPIIAGFSFVVALLIKGIQLLISRRRTPV